MSAGCGFCGRDPAEGFATINDRRYCHGDWYPTCYMLASWKDAGTLDLHLRPELADLRPVFVCDVDENGGQA